MARHKRSKQWSPGDWDFATRLHLLKGGAGGYVYLTKEHLAFALGREKGPPEPAKLLATRTVLDPGTGQILIRLKKG